MAAAALLRSVARKMARAPPPPARPHLGARSGPGYYSLPPPPARNEIQDPRRNRLVVGMAAAAAGLPSLASKEIARAPPLHRLLHDRGLHSSRTSPTNQSFPLLAKLASLSSVGIAGLVYFWLLPAIQEMEHRKRDLLRERETLVKAVDECRRTHTNDALPLAQSCMQALEHGKEPGGASAGDGTRVHNLEK